MEKHDCLCQCKAIGQYQCDLSRIDGDPRLYSALFHVVICVECGRTQLFCESHQAVCAWLRDKHSPNQPIR